MRVCPRIFEASRTEIKSYLKSILRKKKKDKNRRKRKTKQGGNLQERAWVQGKAKEEATEM